MTWDEMKLARDGHLSPTKVEPEHPGLEAVFRFVYRYKDGTVLTTDGGVGHIEWRRIR